MYLALDENGIVVLDDNMKPVVSNTTEENAPIVWPDGANMYAKRIVCDMALRVEVSAIPPKVRDQKGKKMRRDSHVRMQRRNCLSWLLKNC